jgi:hypothetical protein
MDLHTLFKYTRVTSKSFNRSEVLMEFQGTKKGPKLGPFDILLDDMVLLFVLHRKRFFRSKQLSLYCAHPCVECLSNLLH